MNAAQRTALRDTMQLLVDAGPQLIKLSRQRQFHHLPVTLLDVSGIGPA